MHHAMLFSSRPKGLRFRTWTWSAQLEPLKHSVQTMGNQIQKGNENNCSYRDITSGYMGIWPSVSNVGCVNRLLTALEQIVWHVIKGIAERSQRQTGNYANQPGGIRPGWHQRCICCRHSIQSLVWGAVNRSSPGLLCIRDVFETDMVPLRREAIA